MIWKGGARGRADGVILRRRHKITPEQSGLCSGVTRCCNYRSFKFSISCLEDRPTALLGRRRVCAVQAFPPKAKILAQGWRCHPEHFNHRRVEPPFGRRNPKEKYICFSRCLSLLEGKVKIDISVKNEICRPQGGTPTVSPAMAGRSWKGGAAA